MTRAQIHKPLTDRAKVLFVCNKLCRPKAQRSVGWAEYYIRSRKQKKNKSDSNKTDTKLTPPYTPNAHIWLVQAPSRSALKGLGCLIPNVSYDVIQEEGSLNEGSNGFVLCVQLRTHMALNKLM